MGPTGLLMFEGQNQAIHDLLAARGLVAAERLQTIWAGQPAPGKSLAALVLEQGLLEKPALLHAIAEHLGCECADELPTTISGEALALVPGSLARAWGVAPLAAGDDAIAVAAIDPFNPHLANDLAFSLGREVRVCVADPERVERLIRRHYGTEEVSLKSALAELPSTGHVPEDVASTALTDADIEQLAGQTPLIRFVNAVLGQAIRDGASDIHFEPFERDFKIRCRIDGALQELPPPPRQLALPVISRLKVLANLNIAERRRPQDGRIRLTVDDRIVDLRVSTLPTQFGESVVLRVLDQSAGRLALGQLGLPTAIQAQVEEIIRRPNGIFLVTGPTGSGKTTTLYSCLQQLNSVDAKLLTVEDPVEYEIDGVMQVPVNLGAGLTFARALRTFLRQDPDIVMVGEIRDLETARIAVQASLTGHLVLSTLHTNDAPSAVTRLADMGIEPFLLGSTVEAVLAQRLLRRVCLACRTAFQPDGALCRQLGLAPATASERPIYSAKGCPACGHTGYKGRLGLFEFLLMTEPLREKVARGASLLELRQAALEQGMIPLRAAGLAALFAGETTMEEVLKYT